MAIKVIHVFVDDEQKAKLVKAKKKAKMNWTDFFMQLAED